MHYNAIYVPSVNFQFYGSDSSYIFFINVSCRKSSQLDNSSNKVFKLFPSRSAIILSGTNAG